MIRVTQWFLKFIFNEVWIVGAYNYYQALFDKYTMSFQKKNKKYRFKKNKK